MFKYLRTDNSDSHPTEIHTIFLEASDMPNSEVPEGSIFNLLAGEIEQVYNYHAPMFLALTGKKYNETAYVKYIPISQNMIFEAPIAKGEDSESFINGTVCDVGINEETGKGLFITLEGGMSFIIVDDSRRKEGFVSVRKL